MPCTRLPKFVPANSTVCPTTNPDVEANVTTFVPLVVLVAVVVIGTVIDVTIAVMSATVTAFELPTIEPVPVVTVIGVPPTVNESVNVVALIICKI